METRSGYKLWSLLLKPGPPVSIVPSHSIRITNAALAFDLQDPHGRSTLTLTHDDGRADTVLCSLFGGRMEQSTLNIILGEGNSFVFTLRGKNDVYLTGNAIPNESPLAPLSRGSVPDHPRQSKRLKRLAPEPDAPPLPPKEPFLAMKAAENKTIHPIANVTEKETLVIGKDKAKSSAPNIAIKDGVAGAGEVLTRDKGKANPKILAPAVAIKDATVGVGPMVTLGCKVEVNYLMRLTNNTVVQDFQHKTISFVVGHGEVIKGWDDNIVGVRVGTHRQLIIPPELAYENKGCGHIGPGEVVVVDFVVMSVSGGAEEQTE